MNRNWPEVLKLILKHEGGFINHPSDPGGATNKGITIGTFRRYVKRNGTVADLRRITDEQVSRVYRQHYWDKVRGDDLPDGVDYAVADFAVNSGPSRAIRYLQKVVGVKQDGIIGPVTMAAVRAMGQEAIINEYCDERIAFLRRAKDKKGRRLWPTFGNGWKRRVAGVRSNALGMVRSGTQSVPAPDTTEPPESGFWARMTAFFNAMFGRS